LDSEVIDGPEMYFQPKEILHSKETPLMNMIMDCFKENNEFNSTKVINRWISGGGANVPGLYERLQKELNFMLPGREIKLKISQGDSERTSIFSLYRVESRWRACVHMGSIPH
jgi:actin-related protein